MGLKQRISSLEKQVALDSGLCPHSPVIVHYVDPKGKPCHHSGAEQESAPPCSCGGEQLVIHIQYANAS